MRKSGGRYKRSYPERVALVRRYLETDDTAEEIANEIEVQVSTFRRWVRDLRTEVEGAAEPDCVESGESVVDYEQGRLPLAQNG